MADVPYTQRRKFQFRGPQNSDDYNARIEEEYKDLVFLRNKIASLNADMNNGFLISIKDSLSLLNFIETFEDRLLALEQANSSIAFVDADQIDNARFDSAPSFTINSVDRCTYHDPYNVLTLPLVESSSLSKIKYTDDNGTFNIPASLEMFVSPIQSSADNASAIIDTSQPYNALMSRVGKIWERNVITTTQNLSNGAQCYLYVRIPSDLAITPDINSLSFTPFPLKSIDVLEIAYTTDTNVIFGAASNQWTVFNNLSHYYNVPGAAGNIIPGGWSGDEILSSGMKNFYFDPLPITGIRFKLRQKNSFSENGKYIYSYGMSKLDIRYDKFLNSGKAMIRFDAPNGSTISNITSLTPQIWNIPENSVSTCFSSRVIWETSYNSGSYTLTPVPLSKRVWVEVTLNKTELGGSPSLSGLILKYT